MFAEAVFAAEEARPREGRADQVRRAVELAHHGKLSKSLGALTSGGILPLEEETVRDAFTAILQPNNPGPVEGWRAFVTRVGDEGPESDVYKF